MSTICQGIFKVLDIRTIINPEGFFFLVRMSFLKRFYLLSFGKLLYYPDFIEKMGYTAFAV